MIDCLTAGVQLACGSGSVKPQSAADASPRHAHAHPLHICVSAATEAAHSEGGDGNAWKVCLETAELKIGGPKVVTPFADAVCFIDSNRQQCAQLMGLLQILSAR